MRLTETEFMSPYTLVALHETFAPRYCDYISKIYIGDDPFFITDDDFYIERLCELTSMLVDAFARNGGIQKFGYDDVNSASWCITLYAMHGEGYVDDVNIERTERLFSVDVEFAKSVFKLFVMAIESAELSLKKDDLISKHAMEGKNREFIENLRGSIMSDMNLMDCDLSNDPMLTDTFTIKDVVNEVLRYVFTTKMVHPMGLGKRVLVADTIVRYYNMYENSGRETNPTIKWSVVMSLCNHIICKSKGVGVMYDQYAEAGYSGDECYSNSYLPKIVEAICDRINTIGDKGINKYKRNIGENLRKIRQELKK